METKQQRRYRYFLYGVLLCTTIGILYMFHFGVRRQMPDTYRIRQGKESQIDFMLPMGVTIRSMDGVREIQLKPNKTVSVLAGDSPCYVMEVSAFGMLPVRQVKLENAKTEQVYASGMPVGIYVRTLGVMVIDTGDFLGISGERINPAQGILESGDYILKVNGTKAISKRQVIQLIEHSKGQQFVFEILRNGEVSQVALTPEQNEEGIYKAGIWIRDSAQGVGTISFFTKDGDFAALGHGINDYDTGQLMQIEHGSIYETDILSIRKAQSGVPGQITGLLTLDDSDYLGAIDKNTGIGIYGNVEGRSSDVQKLYDKDRLYEIAYKQEIKKGPAQMLSDVSGEPAFYDVEILDLYYNDKNRNQGILLKVTDDRLLALTGGIVQGQSGSPLIQNGKLIGAVTHVFVNDATKGYGIFIENMLNP